MQFEDVTTKVSAVQSAGLKFGISFAFRLELRDQPECLAPIVFTSSRRAFSPPVSLPSQLFGPKVLPRHPLRPLS